MNTTSSLNAYSLAGTFPQSQAHSSIPQVMYPQQTYPPEPQSVPSSRSSWSHSSDWKLSIAQQPKHAKAASSNKEKDRKPIDPPPVIRLDYNTTKDPYGHYKHSPYYFVTAHLIGATDEDKDPGSNCLTGSLSATGHNVKDQDNEHNMYFVFGDISVKKEGKFRLKFTLHKLDGVAGECLDLVETISDPFESYPGRNFPGMAESTHFTRSLSEQGVRLRIRKDSRATVTRKRNKSVADYSREHSEHDRLTREVSVNGDMNRPIKRMRSSHDVPTGYAGNGGYINGYSPNFGRRPPYGVPSTSSIGSMGATTMAPSDPFRIRLDTSLAPFHGGLNSATSDFSPIGPRDSPGGFSAHTFGGVHNSPLTPHQSNGIWTTSPHSSHNSHAFSGLGSQHQPTDMHSPPGGGSGGHGQQPTYGHQQPGQHQQTSTGGSSPEQNYTTSTGAFGGMTSYTMSNGQGGRNFPMPNLGMRQNGAPPVLPQPNDVMYQHMSQQ